MEILRAENIHKTFRGAENRVLNDVSLKVDKGEFVSIMGKSGCGKSTLLYVLSTMDRDYTGEIYLNGELLGDKNPDELAHIRNKHIGFVFQFHYLLPEFTVLDNVMMPGLKLGEKTREEVEHDAIEKLRMLDISELANKLATQISGGQKQRVAIARALINEPQIIMGDEPTGNLDSKNANLVFDIFRELCTSRTHSMLIVTHDHDFAAKSDRIIEMADGKVV